MLAVGQCDRSWFTTEVKTKQETGKKQKAQVKAYINKVFTAK